MGVGLVGCWMVCGFYPAGAAEVEEGFISLFDGKTLDGWKAAENPAAFRVEDGAIVAHGTRGHLFYVGPVQNHDFKNFELKAEVMTAPGSNSGIYFHTRYQEVGWPAKGLEVQVNNTYTRDPIKTGSLYQVANVTTPPAKDNQWFTIHVTVRGKHVTVAVDGRKVVDYTEPEDNSALKGGFDRRLSHGTFALQAHDPGSTVRFRNRRVWPAAWDLWMWITSRDFTSVRVPAGPDRSRDRGNNRIASPKAARRLRAGAACSVESCRWPSWAVRPRRSRGADTCAARHFA